MLSIRFNQRQTDTHMTPTLDRLAGKHGQENEDPGLMSDGLESVGSPTTPPAAHARWTWRACLSSVAQASSSASAQAACCVHWLSSSFRGRAARSRAVAILLLFAGFYGAFSRCVLESDA